MTDSTQVCFHTSIMHDRLNSSMFPHVDNATDSTQVCFHTSILHDRLNSSMFPHVDNAWPTQLKDVVDLK